jgi:transposase
MESHKQFIGVDVGSTELIKTQGIQHAPEKFVKLPVDAIPNTIISINQWIATLPKNSHIIFESTGNYSLNLAYCLEIADVCFTIITPNQSNGFAQTMKVANQNDAIDATLLAYYGAKYQPTLTTIENQNLHHLKQKRKHLSSLMAQKQVITNQLHALSYDARADKNVVDSLELLQQTFLNQIKQFEKELFTLDDQQYQELYELITSVVGIGEKSANAIIIATDGFKNFKAVKEVLCFFGIVPKQKDSGKTVRKKYGISQSGVAYVRALLYMAARSARRFNLACKKIYDNQRNMGKAHKIAMVAVMNKLVRQVFAVVTKKTHFLNDYEVAK